MATDYLPNERELSRSEEEEKLLRDIREEKERLWLEIQVCRRLRLAYRVCRRLRLVHDVSKQEDSLC